jgi:biotin carboxyl carrier protein
MKYITTINDQEFTVEILDSQRIKVDEEVFTVDFDSIGDHPVYSLLMNGESYEAYVYPAESTLEVLLRGRLYPVQVEDERERRLRLASHNSVTAQSEFHLKAPMPGLVVDVPVIVGDEVEQGDVLVILESMKMQNELKAPRDGKVNRVNIKLGDSVEQHQVLVMVE